MVGRPAAGRTDGIVRAATAITRIPMGRLTRKHQCHERWSVKKPPRSGPITVVTPKTAPRAPWYLPRSRSGTTSAISAVAVTMRPPAPIPCTARHPTSQPMLPASAHINEAPTKRPALSWKISLRPNRSPNFPARTVAMVSVRRYDVTTHETCDPPPRSATMVGRAVETIVWSRAASSIPSMIVPKTRLIWRRVSVGATGSGRATADAIPEPPAWPPGRRSIPRNPPTVVPRLARETSPVRGDRRVAPVRDA